MEFEHVGINVPEARAMAAWYVAHCGMRAVRALGEPPYTHFLADAGGRVVLEIYTNPADTIPDYAAQHPLQYHLALADDDPAGQAERLVAAGASLATDETLPDGSRVITLRDPWGVPLQLARRAAPLTG